MRRQAFGGNSAMMSFALRRACVGQGAGARSTNSGFGPQSRAANAGVSGAVRPRFKEKAAREALLHVSAELGNDAAELELVLRHALQLLTETACQRPA
jgi:hypothetical protein